MPKDGVLPTGHSSELKVNADANESHADQSPSPHANDGTYADAHGTVQSQNAKSQG